MCSQASAAWAAQQAGAPDAVSTEHGPVVVHRKVRSSLLRPSRPADPVLWPPEGPIAAPEAAEAVGVGERSSLLRPSRPADPALPRGEQRAQLPVLRASAASGDAGPHGWQLAFPAPLGKNTGNVSAPPRRALWEFYELRDRYRRFAGRRCAKCGRVRIAPCVEISKRDGRAHPHGVMRCGLAWECPVCQLALRTARAAEVLTVVQWHTSTYDVESAALLTLTVRHGLGNDLSALRSGIVDAYRYLQGGRAWPEWKASVGFVGSIKALEVTHGENGWHPHLHIVLLTERPLSNQDRAWLSERWQRAVLRALGPDHVPDDAHGCDLRPCHAADYLVKLGLEVSPPDKAGRGDHRTPLQLLMAFACDGDLNALALYQAYAVGMKGAKMLTWTAGLKRAAGVDDRTDEAIVEGEDAPEEHVATIKGEAWDALRDISGMKVAILAVAESQPPDVVTEWLRQLPLWPPGYDPIASVEEDLWGGATDFCSAPPDHVPDDYHGLGATRSIRRADGV